jgi:phospholipid/cholesterol/gamma-HCH transport system substrate-binding protein
LTLDYACGFGLYLTPMNRNIIETISGAVVLAVAAGFFAFAYQGSETGMQQGDGYTVKAKFANAAGISIGSDVRVGGIKVGVVKDMTLDPESYEAVAHLFLSKNNKIPADSSAAIASSGLLGDKFIALAPGGDDRMLKEGSTIQFTQSSVSLEELIGKFVFSGGGVDKGAAMNNASMGTAASATDSTLAPDIHVPAPSTPTQK